jgi:hypothetical protein
MFCNQYRSSSLFSLFFIAVACLLGLFLNNVYSATGIFERINIQGKITDDDGTNASAACISGDTCDFRFRIYDSASSGILLWEETQSDVVISDGIFNINLGSSTSLDDSDLENFNRDDLWLQIEFDPDGDASGYEDIIFQRFRTPTIQNFWGETSQLHI